MALSAGSLGFEVFMEQVEVLRRSKTELVPYEDTLPRRKYFHGIIDQQAVNQRLVARQKPGSFAVRHSSKPGGYAFQFTRSDRSQSSLLVTVKNGIFQCADENSHRICGFKDSILSQRSPWRLMMPLLASIRYLRYCSLQTWLKMIATIVLSMKNP